jgi:alanine-glyoxylate transaminase/serine-glyoxylate transaminase/serine-pyruvate transaminase
MAAPSLSHLDPHMLALMDDVRERLGRLFGLGDGGIAFAVSGTGSAGMETTVANLVAPGHKVLSVVTGYFGERLAATCERFGATVTRVEAPWGRAIDPIAVETALGGGSFDVLTIVHAETSTGVLNPVETVAALANTHGAMTIVDAVTSLGAHPVEVGRWGVDACYSCSQKGVGAPSGMAPVAFSARAREKATSHSFYFDLHLLEDYWLNRKYHHTISAPMVYALLEALRVIDDEGMEVRSARHAATHALFKDALHDLGLSLLPPEGERLWTLNAVALTPGIDDAAVRTALRDRFNIEIGAGLGPLAGKIWRVGLMGAGSTELNVRTLHAALAALLKAS